MKRCQGRPSRVFFLQVRLGIGIEQNWTQLPLFGPSSISCVPFFSMFSLWFVNLGLHWTAKNAFPSLLLAGYQGMFAVITPALMTGAFADRFRFKPYLIFIAVWLASRIVWIAVSCWFFEHHCCWWPTLPEIGFASPAPMHSHSIQEWGKAGNHDWN